MTSIFCPYLFSIAKPKTRFDYICIKDNTLIMKEDIEGCKNDFIRNCRLFYPKNFLINGIFI